MPRARPPSRAGATQRSSWLFLLACGDRDRNQKAYRIKMHARPNHVVFSYVRCQRFLLSRRSQKRGFSSTSSYLPSLKFNPPPNSVAAPEMSREHICFPLRCLLQASLPVSRVSLLLSNLFLTRRLEKFL